MMDLLDIWIILPWIGGILFGLFIGATPGLTATMAVALIVPVSFHIPDPMGGLAMILGVSFTAIFAGDLPATFLKIPGTPASTAATLDAYAMHQNGQGGVAIHTNLICSCLGGIIGVVCLALSGPVIAKWSLRMDSPEYFWLAVAGISISAMVSGKNILVGLMAAGLGVFLSTIGMDKINGAQRLTFGVPELQEGIQLIPMMIGLFGMAEIMTRLTRHSSHIGDTSNDWKSTILKGSLACAFRKLIKFPGTIIRSSLLGCGIGALPGAGADIGAWVGYGASRKLSPRASHFGTGEIEGVIAPTSANNAAVAGAWVPALVFGIPGDAVTAIVVGAFIMYGIEPGPEVFTSDNFPMSSLLWIAALTQILLFIIGLAGIRGFSLILKLPSRVLESFILVFCFVGAYAIRNSTFDLWVMLVFGMVGLVMNRYRIPIAPLILGFILGGTIESEFRSGLIASSGKLTPFFTSPFFFIFALIAGGGIVLKALNNNPKSEDQ